MAVRSRAVPPEDWRCGKCWWQGFLAHLPDAYLDFVIPETFATRSLIYAPLQVPEPLCTRRYAEALVANDPGIREDAEATVVEAMRQRKQIVVEERRTELTVVIGEAALRQQTGGEAALRQQLIHLAGLTSTDYPHITIRILPFETSTPAAGGTGGFSLLTFEEIPSLHVAHLAGPAGGLCLHHPAITAGYAKAFETLNAYALDPARSARKLVTLANLKAASRLDRRVQQMPALMPPVPLRHSWGRPATQQARSARARPVRPHHARLTPVGCPCSPVRGSRPLAHRAEALFVRDHRSRPGPDRLRRRNQGP